MKRLTKKQMKTNEKIARDILAFLKEKSVWMDVVILFNNKAWSSNKTFKGIKGNMIEEPYENEFDDFY